MTAKAFLEEYKTVVELVEIYERRLDFCGDETAAQKINAASIREELDASIETAKKERGKRMALINKIKNVQQRNVLLMRYIDLQSWDTITAAMFGNMAEFYDRPENYKRRTYRLHGRALQELDAILKKQQPEPKGE